MHEQTVHLGETEIRLQTGEIAPQAGGSVILRAGDTVILAAVTAAREAKKIGFLPLTVEYREPMAAAGRIPGSYHRREARPTEREILTSRIIDRTVRALFPKQWRVETQLFVTVMSHDPEVDPSALGVIAASAALHISDIPWDGPAGAVAVTRVRGRSFTAQAGSLVRANSELELVVSCDGRGGLVMVEGEASQLPEADMIAALEHARAALEPVHAAIQHLRSVAGKPKRAVPELPAPPEAAARAAEEVRGALEEALRDTDRDARRDRVRAIADGAVAVATRGVEEADAAAELEATVRELVFEMQHEMIRAAILTQKRRLDGRPPDQVRPITIQTGFLPRAHGSAVFTRGMTQAVVSATLGSARDSQEIESLDGVVRERFLLHYNFPPYSVGEVRPARGPGRREIGHGHLARRAIVPVLPSADDYPYTIRIVSDITSSNGSSSMASICGGTLALMDAGVPLAAPVAGVAMGLVHGEGETVVLTDILGDEDHHGDMDFKVAGTERGITALQLDSKMGAVPRELLERALEQARLARLHILDAMRGAIAEPRAKPTAHAPRAATRRIRPNRIRDLIGPGGKIIQGITSATGVKIDVNDDGLVSLFAGPEADMDAALAQVDHCTGEAKVGGIYEGTVTGVKDFGTFVELFRGIEGFLPSSELARDQLAAPTQGAKVRVLVRGVDDRGRIALTRRVPT